MINFFKYGIILLFIINNNFLPAQNDSKLNKHRPNFLKIRLSFSPVISFYKINKNHALSPKAKMAFNFSIKEEIRLDKTHKNFLFLGIDYMYHGINFNSYFFYTDSLKLYITENLKYKYSLVMHELDFPILFKHSFNNENNNLFSGYLFAGYYYRWLLDSQLKITENGTELLKKRISLSFKIPVFNKFNSSFLSIGAGFQKKSRSKKHTAYAELQFKYGLSPIYFSESFSASSIYVQSHFLLLTIGLKF